MQKFVNQNITYNTHAISGTFFSKASSTETGANMDRGHSTQTIFTLLCSHLWWIYLCFLASTVSLVTCKKDFQNSKTKHHQELTRLELVALESSSGKGI